MPPSSYVYGSKFDTKGLMYPRALQQLFVGLYIAEVCIVGLFAIGMKSSPKGAVGPLILMIVFLIFTALYHMSLNAALDPLLKFLPKTLETEERRLLAMEEHDVESAEMTGNGAGTKATPHTSDSSKSPHHEKSSLAVSSAYPSRKKPNMFAKFFRPDIYTDYYTMRRLVPRNFASVQYDDKTQSDAYHHPAVLSQPPLLWVPRDPVGVSREEVGNTSRVIAITDEGAHLDEKNNIVWDTENARGAPIYEEKIYY